MSPSLVLLAGVVAERVVEAAEVRQVRHVGHQALDARLEAPARAALPPRCEALVDLAGEVRPAPDQVRRRRCACC